MAKIIIRKKFASGDLVGWLNSLSSNLKSGKKSKKLQKEVSFGNNCDFEPK